MGTRMQNNIVGIDEVGRSSVCGPLVIAGLKLKSGQESYLHQLGVKDSKLLPNKEIDKLSPQIISIGDLIYVSIIEPEQIDSFRDKGQSLNDIETKIIADIIQAIGNDAKVYIDSLHPTKAFLSKLSKMVDISNVYASYNADVNIPVVSAASIIAKNHRNVELKILEKEYGRICDGCFPDYHTQQLILNTYPKKLPFVRYSWSPVKKLIKSFDIGFQDDKDWKKFFSPYYISKISKHLKKWNNDNIKTRVEVTKCRNRASLVSYISINTMNNIKRKKIQYNINTNLNNSFTIDNIITTHIFTNFSSIKKGFIERHQRKIERYI